MKISVMIIILLFIPLISDAQKEHIDTILPLNKMTKGIELGKRYLKLGNTYLAAGNMPKAIEYIEKGYGIVNKYGNDYWTAAAYEYFGYYYREQGDKDKALEYLKKAKNIYDRIIVQKDGSNAAIDQVIDLLINHRAPDGMGDMNEKQTGGRKDDLDKTTDVNRKKSSRKISKKGTLPLVKLMEGKSPILNEPEDNKTPVDVVAPEKINDNEKVAYSIANYTKFTGLTAENSCHCTGGHYDISDIDYEVLYELNFVRTDPQGYADMLRETRSSYKIGYKLSPSGVHIITKEGISALEEAINVLDNTEPMKPLIISGCLCRSAMDHILDQGPRGSIGHYGSGGSDPTERVNRYADCYLPSGECIAYGPADARSIVMNLIIDDGVPDRGHRKNILTPAFSSAGIGVGPHKTYRHMCVIDFTFKKVISENNLVSLNEGE